MDGPKQVHNKDTGEGREQKQNFDGDSVSVDPKRYCEVVDS